LIVFWLPMIHWSPTIGEVIAIFEVAGVAPVAGALGKIGGACVDEGVVAEEVEVPGAFASGGFRESHSVRPRPKMTKTRTEIKMYFLLVMY